MKVGYFSNIYGQKQTSSRLWLSGRANKETKKQNKTKQNKTKQNKTKTKTRQTIKQNKNKKANPPKMIYI